MERWRFGPGGCAQRVVPDRLQKAPNMSGRLSKPAAQSAKCRSCSNQTPLVNQDVDADAELTHVPTQDCPTPSRQKSSIGNDSRGIRLGQWHLGHWVNSASAPTSLLHSESNSRLSAWATNTEPRRISEGASPGPCSFRTANTGFWRISGVWSPALGKSRIGCVIRIPACSSPSHAGRRYQQKWAIDEYWGGVLSGNEYTRLHLWAPLAAPSSKHRPLVNINGFISHLLERVGSVRCSEYRRFYLPAPLAAPPRKHGTLINIGGGISHPVAGPNQPETNIEGFVSRLRGCYGAHLGS